jgi:hypothetical protein
VMARRGEAAPPGGAQLRRQMLPEAVAAVPAVAVGRQAFCPVVLVALVCRKPSRAAMAHYLARWIRRLIAHALAVTAMPVARNGHRWKVAMVGVQPLTKCPSPKASRRPATPMAQTPCRRVHRERRATRWACHACQHEKDRGYQSNKRGRRFSDATAHLC